ncbi:hypothetical protein BKN51_22080 [Amycolatopsis sp. BJA-103]|nr:hypothetical protein BKN51_22080 [Amycolatopsis sp. BJA-103]
MSTSRLCRGLAVATVAAAFSGLLGIPAHAAEPPPGQAVPPAIPTAEPDVGSTTILPATQREKYDAVNAIHVGEPTDDWLRLSDKNFVFRIYDKISIDKFPRTKAEASRVYGLAVPDASVFIRTGVHEFVQRDQDEQVLRDAEKQHRVTTRMKAIENAHIAPDPAMLDLTDRNFVFQVFSRATTGSKVKAGAATAYQGDAAVWKTFIEVTVLELAEQDDFAAIEKARQQSEEEAQRVERELKRRSAVAAIPATFQTVWLQAPDDVFIRELLRLPELAVPANVEIKDAADLASRSTDPAVWRTFVNTGLKQAADRGKARREREEDEANRRVVREIRTRAENGGVRPRLVAAADTALTGSRSDVVAFLREGQYQVLNQSLQTVTPGVKGWYVHSGGGDAWITPGRPVPTAPNRCRTRRGRSRAGSPTPSATRSNPSTAPGTTCGSRTSGSSCTATTARTRSNGTRPGARSAPAGASRWSRRRSRAGSCGTPTRSCGSRSSAAATGSTPNGCSTRTRAGRSSPPTPRSPPR